MSDRTYDDDDGDYDFDDDVDELGNSKRSVSDEGTEEENAVASPDEKVGFGKPPKHRQFQKGRSGNPRGRPRGSKSIAAIVREQCGAKVSVRENGRTKTVPLGQAIVMKAMRDGLTGSNQAIDRALKLVVAFGPSAPAPAEEPDDLYDVSRLEILTDEELEQLERLSRKIYEQPRPEEED